MSALSTRPLVAPTCPLCGLANGCQAVEQGRFDVACWCSEVEFPDALVASADAQGESPACICERCLAGASPGAA